MKNSLCLGLLISLVASNLLRGEDWPQWQGSQRDGVIREKGLIKEIPLTGLKVRWRKEIAGGYSGPAVADQRVYVTDYVRSSGDPSNDPGGRRELVGQERIHCFDAQSGELLWSHAYACQYNISYPAGPRATPTIADGVVISLGAEGDLVCLDAKDGSLRWQKSLKQTYKTETPIWGYSAPPLVIDGLVITLAGGEGSVVVALDLKTGEEKWRALSATEIGYCPPTLLERNGTRQLLIWTADELCSLEPKSGSVNWQLPLKPRYGMSIAAPRVEGDFLYASGIGDTGAMYKLSAGKEPPTLLWKGKPKMALYSANATPVFVDGMVYGADCQVGSFVAFKAEDGTRAWETFSPTTGKPGRASHGTAFVNRFEDRFYVFTETGDFVIAQLSPEKYTEISRFHVLEPTGECFGRNVVWAYPAYANGSLVVRNDREIVSIDISASGK